MRHYIKFEAKLFLKDRKNLLLIGLFIVFLGITYWIITAQGVGDLEQEAYEEVNQTRLGLLTSQQHSPEDEEEQSRSQNILQQQDLATRSYNGIIFGNDHWYVPNSLELAELRVSMHEIGLEDIPDELFPPENEARQDVEYYGYLTENNMPIQVDSQTAMGYLETVLMYFGVGAFFFLLLLGSNVFTDDLEHSSMVDAYPLSTSQRMQSKLVIYVLFSFLTTLVLTLAGTIVISFIWPFGFIDYPVAYYSSGEFVASPLWQFVLIFFTTLFALAIHVILLCALGNKVLKNQYATIFLGGFLYTVPFLFEHFSSLFFWSPTNFYNLTALFDGVPGVEVHPFIHWQSGILILIGSGILFVLGIVGYERWQNISAVKGQTIESRVS